MRPLHLLAENKGMERVAEALIEHGADLEARHAYGSTPLMSAVTHGRTQLAALLIAQGADVTVKNKAGEGLTAVAPKSAAKLRALLKSPKTAKTVKSRRAKPRRADEYENFLAKKEYLKLNNRRSELLPGGRDTQHVRFFIDGKVLGLEKGPYAGWGEAHVLGDLEDTLDGDAERADKISLFAVFDANGKGSLDSGALVLDASKFRAGVCPVFLYGDGGLEKVAGSIREFLQSLAPPTKSGRTKR
jgi:hypothetical protein